MTSVRAAWTVRLLAVALLLGGLRDPRLFALGGAAVWAVAWFQRPPLGPAAAWLPWLGWALLATLFSASPLSGLPVLARWGAVLAYASLAASWGEEEREEWVKTLLASAATLGAAALATGAGHGWRNTMTGLVPPYYNYTVFVLSAAVVAAAVWVSHPRGPRGKERAAAVAVGLLGLLCIVLSRSRGGLLGLGAALLVWTARRWGARALAGASLGLGGVLALALAVPITRQALLKNTRIHGEARPAIWKAAVLVASEAPFLGEGPGSFLAGFRRHPAPSPTAAARWGLSTAYAHCEPLQVAAETGWLGLILWLLGAGGALRVLLRRADADPIREAAAIAAAAMSAQLLVDNMLQIPALAALWLSALAVAIPSRGTARWPRSAAAAGVLLALTAWIPAAIAARGPERAAALFPSDVDSRETLAWRAEQAGDPARARVLWEEAEKLAPFNAVYPARRARLDAMSERWADAELLAARALELEPGFFRMRLLRAEALMRLGRRDDARAEAAELRRRLSAPAATGEFGYERAVTAFTPADVAQFLRLESALRRR